jgi:hypothetical protein
MFECSLASPVYAYDLLGCIVCMCSHNISVCGMTTSHRTITAKLDHILSVYLFNPRSHIISVYMFKWVLIKTTRNTI